MLRLLPLPRAALDPAGQTLARKESLQISREPMFTLEGVGGGLGGTSLSVKFLQHSDFSFVISWWVFSSGSEIGRKIADGPGFGWDICGQISAFL